MSIRQWWALLKFLVLTQLLVWYLRPRRDSAVWLLLLVLAAVVVAVCAATAGMGPA